MFSREKVGIAVTLLGLMLIPLALFGDPRWWIAVVVVAVAGMAIHTTKRVADFEKKYGPAPGASAGFGLHTDQIPHAPKMGKSSHGSDFSDFDGGDGD